MKSTDYLVTPSLDDPKGWRYPIDHNAIADMAKRASRESDENRDRLTNVIRGRTVALLLNGASVGVLGDRAKDFADFDLCYMGVNRFMGIEQTILGKMGRRFEVVFCMSEQDIPKRLDDIRTLLGRADDNVLMTTLCALTWLKEADRNDLIDKYGGKLYLMPRLMCRPAYPISLEVIIDELIAAGVEHLVVFGADGYLAPGMEDMTEEQVIRYDQGKMLKSYYDPGFFAEERRATGVAVGTVRFNKNFVYQPDKMQIINCSPTSYYDHMPKMSYDGVLSALTLGGLCEWK